MPDNTEWNAPAEINTPAVSGLIVAIQAALPATTGGANPAREAAYVEMIAHAIEMRRLLSNVDPQSDASVLTAVTATLNTL